jgi:hypothetical protein
MKDNINYIREEIEKTGFPLELEIYSILWSKNWIPTAQDFYFDEDEKKGRYIDISGFEMPQFNKEMEIINPTEPLWITYNLAIECKKSIKENWVFFPIDDYYVDHSGQAYSTMKEEHGMNFWNYLAGQGFGHYNPSNIKISSLYTHFPKGNDEIFEASMQLIKYISYEKSKIKPRKKSVNAPIFWFPIIVFDGKIWNVFFKDGKLDEIKESKHTILKCRYRSYFTGEIEGFCIDVINKKYFIDLLKIIELDIVELTDILLKDNKKELKSIIKKFNIK